LKVLLAQRLLRLKGNRVPLKILLADDSLTAQNMGKKILTDAGYEVIAVSNGAQAMKKIVAERPDLVVLDVYMPGYSGLEVCERMRNSRETAATPVLLSVGKMEAFKADEASRVRADGVIVKPFEATELVAMTRKMAESLSPVPVTKHAPKPVTPEASIDNEPAPLEPEPEIQRYSVDVPHEIASRPAIGMELIPEELHQDAASDTVPAANGLIEFEVEHDSHPVKVEAGPRMVSADGLSGVFEISPSAPAVAEPTAPAPIEEFDRFPSPDAAIPTQPFSSESAEPRAPGTDVPKDEPQGFVSELQIESFGPTPDFATWTADENDPSEYAVEHFGAAQPATDSFRADAEAPQTLPELTSWQEPSIQAEPTSVDWAVPLPETTIAASDHQFSGDLQDSPEHASVGSVWVAEETEIEPDELAVPLHEQMQQGTMLSETESGVADSPLDTGEAGFVSWEAPEPLAAEPELTELAQLAAEPATVQTNCAPEPESFAAPAAFEQRPEVQDPGPEFTFSTDSSIQPEATEPEQVSTPVSASDNQPGDSTLEAADFAAASLPEPPTSVPAIIEVPVDPLRIARIVDELIERMKPELIAAVTRQLEHKD
jgi:CheY-like chemotaxis protein